MFASKSATSCMPQAPDSDVAPGPGGMAPFAGLFASPPAVRTQSGLRRHSTLPPAALYQQETFSSSVPTIFAGGAPWSKSSFMPLSAIDELSPIGNLSASPSTPGLSYSPTPTELSSGDRTVQMSSFMDVSTPPPGQFATFGSAQNVKVLPAAPGPFVYSEPQETYYHPQTGFKFLGSLSHPGSHFEDSSSAVASSGIAYQGWSSEFVA